MNKLQLSLMVALASCVLPCALASAPVKEVEGRYRPGSLGLTTHDAAKVSGSLTAEKAKTFPEGGAVMAVQVTQHQPWFVKTAEGDEENFESYSLEDRVKRIEQQTNNMANMNMPQEINRLQQEVAELRGQLQEQARTLQLMNKTLTSLASAKPAVAPAVPEATPTVTQTTQTTPATPATTGGDMDEATSYQKAFTLLTKRDYAAAKQGFNSYLSRYATGKFAADAHYWLGEIAVLDKNDTAAEEQFQLVIKQYPSSAKVPDARLKLAIIHASQGKTAQAKEELLLIKKQNPNSTAAQLANIRLQQLEQGAQ